MSKPLTRLYPMEIERLPWLPMVGSDDPSSDSPVMRVLCGEVAGSYTLLVRAENGGEIAPAGGEYWEEIYVVDGSFELDGITYSAGSYLCLPPGSRTEPLSIDVGRPFQAYVFRDTFTVPMDKPHVRLTAEEVDAIDPEKAQAGNDGVQRILAKGPSGSHTRLLEVPPHLDSGVVVHDFSEEGIILKGSYKMAFQLGDEFHPTLTYTYLPPHTYHGPTYTNDGYFCFEVRNMIS